MHLVWVEIFSLYSFKEFCYATVSVSISFQSYLVSVVFEA